MELVSEIDKVLPLAGISSTVPESITDYIDGFRNQDWDIDKPFYGNYADQRLITLSSLRMRKTVPTSVMKPCK